MCESRIKGSYKFANMKRVSATVRGRKLLLHDAWTGGPGWAGLTELQGLTVDFRGGPQLHIWPQAAMPL